MLQSKVLGEIVDETLPNLIKEQTPIQKGEGEGGSTKRKDQCSTKS
jgi:hypothetical protein